MSIADTGLRVYTNAFLILIDFLWKLCYSIFALNPSFEFQTHPSFTQSPISLKKKSIQAPRHPDAKKVYNAELGRLLAQEKIWEVKAANYGTISKVDRNSTTSKLPNRSGYTTIKRKAMYDKAMQLYEQNELVRPIVNLIATSTFSKGQPDFKGSNADLTSYAQEIVTSNDLNFHDLAREGELAGDVFLWYEKMGDAIKVWSLDAGETISILKDGDLRNIAGYAYKSGSENSLSKEVKPNLLPSQVQHLKLNSTTTSQYGRSSLRHLLYWIDVLDKLFEENWLRGAQYYGQPLLAITGVPGPYQATVKAQIESQLQRAGVSWVLPPDTDVKTPSLALDFPIGDIVGWVFRLITIATEIPITLLGSADAASRGSAFFANPRFELAIRARREVWRIGLRRFFIKIFQATGKLAEGVEPKRSEFDIGFLPIFDRDLTDLADVIAITKDRGIMSKTSSREWLGLDASVESELIKKEKTTEPDEMVQAPSSDPVAMARQQARAGQKVKAKSGDE